LKPECRDDWISLSTSSVILPFPKSMLETFCAKSLSRVSLSNAWALDAYQDLLVRGYGLLGVLPKAGALAAFALVFFGIGVWRFRFE
jgi:ABC-type multidrug transport system permease subunit